MYHTKKWQVSKIICDVLTKERNKECKRVT